MDDKLLKQFATNLKMLRNEKNLNLRELSELTGISKTALSYYENCKRDPALSVVKTLADFFDEDINFIVGESNLRRLKKIAQ